MKIVYFSIFFVIYFISNIFASDSLEAELGNTDFLIAVGENNISKVEKLLQNHVDMNYKNKLGLSALRIAVENDYPQMLSLLIKKGAIFDDTSKFIQSIFLNDLSSAEQLLQNGLNPNFKIYKKLYKNYLFEIEIDYPILFAVREQNFELLNLLIQYKANTNVSSSETALMIAVQQNCDFKIIELLLNNNADINAIVDNPDESNSGSALLIAIDNDNIDCARYLLELQADTEIELYNNGAYLSYTPLMLAVKKNNFETVKLLIEFVADVNYKDCHGTSILEVAKKIAGKNIIDLLIEEGAK